MKIENIISRQIWEDRYKKGDETLGDNLRRVAKYISTNKNEEKELFNVMKDRLFFPAGRTMSNSGIGENLTLNNCFVSNSVPDSIDGIFDRVKLGAQTHQKGGGIGYDFSLIRPCGTPTSNDAIASGVVSFMHVFDSQTATILQGSRRGANMSVLSIRHPDIFEYINAKSYEEGRLTHFNLSVMVDDEFMQAVENDSVFTLHYPVYDEKGNIIKDESKWTHKKEIKAKELWDVIIKKAYDNGEPGVLFYDNMNKDNNMWYLEKIISTNPCFTGDMRLLTKDGYKTFAELDGKDVEVVNKDGDISHGRVWCSGEKETVNVVLDNGQVIRCTLDHVFMLLDGSECQAKDLEGKELMPYKENSVMAYVKSVRKSTIEKVYDFNEPLTHWGVVEGFVVHNCGEYLSGVVSGKHPKTKKTLNSDDYMGACNLGSLFLHNFAIQPFEDHARIDWDKLEQTIYTSVRTLDNIIDINKFPHENYENYQKSLRTIGLGVTGLANMLVMLGIRYGSPMSVKVVDELMNFIVKNAYLASIELAKEKGSFPLLDREKFVQSGFIKKHIQHDPDWMRVADGIKKHGIRNARIMSVAPTGTISLSYGENCSSGIEPIFSLSYQRKVKIGGQSDENIQIVDMNDYAYGLWKQKTENNVVPEEMFVTAMDLDVKKHIDILATIAFHTDMSVSKTINVPTDYSFEDTKDIYMDCWKRGIKGCTIFRPNEIRQGILIDSNKKDKSNDDMAELKRGDWKDKALDTVYYQRKIYIGCGKLSLFIGWSESESAIQDFYVTRSGSGGCEKNIQASVIAMSGMLRLGGNLFNIEKAFSGIGGCNSFVAGRMKGENLSKGNSCSTAILNEIKVFLKEMGANGDIEITKKVHKPDKKIIKQKPEEDDSFTESELKFIRDNGEIMYAQRYNRCPKCHDPLTNSGGCITCNSCGFTKCE